MFLEYWDISCSIVYKEGVDGWEGPIEVWHIIPWLGSIIISVIRRMLVLQREDCPDIVWQYLRSLLFTHRLVISLNHSIFGLFCFLFFVIYFLF